MVQPEGSVVGGLPGGNLSLSGAPVNEVLAQLSEKEERAKKKRPGAFWKKPPVKIYADNFGFAVNSYQPMIDYINKKDCGEKPERDVHLPLLEERCMRQYQSNKPVNGYSNSDIDFFIDKGQKIRTSIRQNDACGKSNVLNRTHTNWSMTTKWVQQVKNSSVGNYRKLREGAAREVSPTRSVLSNTSHKAAEFENIPRKIPQSENYRETTPRPNYVDDTSVEFARALSQLSIMESDEATVARKAKLEALDHRFEEAVNQMCNYVNKVTQDRTPQQALVSNQMDSNDYMLRSQKRREMEMANLEESVYDLTDNNSSRNKLRSSLKSLDDHLTSTSSRIQEQQRGSMITDNELKEALNDIRLNRYNSRARTEDDYLRDDTDYLPVQNLGLRVTEERVPVKKSSGGESKGPVITDTYANVVARASDMACLTSEMRKISNRSRFVNCYKPLAKTGDKTQMVQPSKIEMNIDHMANTLAMDGKMRRRFEVDDEIDAPVSNLNSHMKEKYADHKIHKTVAFPPSNSMRVRRADLRAQSRVTLLGY
ncbi:unnamed protein product [Meganyctiphanes norvegica]|uniref:Uncharacterized protein n=1 Tax=Meganyctiphanes norvegica TaxID=48144 RepID=A0AAV2QMP1_MEGNR